jgi:hypothetical protein
MYEASTAKRITTIGWRPALSCVGRARRAGGDCLKRTMFRIVLSAAWRCVVFCALLAVAVPGAAQTPSSLRVTHTVDKTGPTTAELSGHVYNDGSVDVIDVYVNAAAIDQSGKVLAQGIPFVGTVPARGSAPFKARVPVVPGVTGYRVGINSFRFAFGRESP